MIGVFACGAVRKDQVPGRRDEMVDPLLDLPQIRAQRCRNGAIVQVRDHFLDPQFTRCAALDEAQKAHGAKLCSLAPGVIDTDMQVQLRSTDPALFPDAENFAQMKTTGSLATPEAAAARVLEWLAREDFGQQPVADVRDA